MASEKETKLEKQFLDRYRDLEAALRDGPSLMVTDIERNLESQSRQHESSMLRMCRVTRNFLVHDGPGFASVTPPMIQLLDDLIYEVRTADGTAKDRMETLAKYGSVKPSDRICDAGSLILSKKHGDAIVLDENGMLAGLFDARALAMALSNGACSDNIGFIMKRGGLRGKLPVVRIDTPVKELPGHRAVVLDKGGKPKGVVDAGRPWPWVL